MFTFSPTKGMDNIYYIIRKFDNLLRSVSIIENMLLKSTTNIPNIKTFEYKPAQRQKLNTFTPRIISHSHSLFSGVEKEKNKFLNSFVLLILSPLSSPNLELLTEFY